MLNAIRREPALFGTAVAVTADGVAWFAGASTEGQAVIHGIVLAWLALLIRSLSTPTVKADEAVAAVQADASARVDEAVAGVDEKVDTARYVGAVEHQALATAGRLVEAAKRSRTRPRPSSR
jgi:hypothetical protein